MTSSNQQQTENTQQKVQKTVRMDLALSEALNAYVHELGRGKAPKEKPSIDSVIQDAVRRMLDSPANADTQDNTGTKLTSVLHKFGDTPEHPSVIYLTSDQRHISVSALEWDWIQMLLRVIRGRSPQPVEAVDSTQHPFRALSENLDAFAQFRDLQMEVARGSSKGISVPHSPADIQRTMESLSEVQELSEASATETGEAIRATEEAAKPLRSPRKPARGRGAESA